MSRDYRLPGGPAGGSGWQILLPAWLLPLLVFTRQAPAPLLAGLVLLVAFLYASVGFGGATGYLAVMSFFAISPPVAASTALTLNVVVAGIAFTNYTLHGHLQARLLWPFLLASIPAAFLGGTLRLEQVTYQVLLNVVLLYVAARMLFSNHLSRPDRVLKPPSWLLALASGAALGLLSGMLGIGGGIFLSPLILLAGWGAPKQAAASSAGFILLNSLSGLAGRAWSGALEFGQFGGWLVILGVIGGIAGSTLGARFLSGLAVRRLLGVVLLIAVARFVAAALGS